MSAPPIVDTHCHLDYIVRALSESTDRDSTISPADEVLQRAKEAGVQWLLNPGVGVAAFPEIITLAERYDCVYAAVAIHPTDVHETFEYPDWLEQIQKALEHPKVIAIGETGLDYYRPEQQTADNQALQHSCFRDLLHLARERDVPIIIHDREAHADVLRLVQEFPGVRGIMHCFSGDIDFAHAMTKEGFYISFAGNLTFKNAANLHRAAQELPLEAILTETDAPFLSPVPFRGKANEPERVRYVVEKIAELKNIPYAHVANQTVANAIQVFGLV
jgi:TatD DNase family protein